MAFGRRVSHLDLQTAEETHLRNALYDIRELATWGSYLYIHDESDIQSVDKLTGSLLEWDQNNRYSYFGFSLAEGAQKIFARRGGSPADIVEIPLNGDGTFEYADDSPYHGTYPGAQVTYAFPSGLLVADNSGTVHQTSDLTYANSFGGALDDLVFYGDVPIVLRGDTISAYTNTLLKQSDVALDHAPARIVLFGDTVFTFRDEGQGPIAVEVPLDSLQPPAPGAPVDPVGLPYVPDAIAQHSDGTVFLLSRPHASVFRWNAREGGYAETLTLSDAPNWMTLSEADEKLYFGYTAGEVTSIDLLGPQPVETPFVNLPNTVCGLAATGTHLFTCEYRSSSSVTFKTFAFDATEIASDNWRAYRSQEFRWSEANGRLYHLRLGISPNDLHSREIFGDGTFGNRLDSPFHSSDGMTYPIRVAPDGSVLLLGSGRLFDAVTLQLVNTLSNNVADAAWRQDQLFTLRDVGAATEIQAWTPTLAIATAVQVSGTPLHLASAPQALLAITHENGVPVFSLWDRELNPLPLDFVFATDFESGLSDWSASTP